MPTPTSQEGAPDLALAREALGSLLPQSASSIPTPETVLASVCTFYSVTNDALCSRRRDSSISKARQVAIYLLREVSLKNLREIGSLLGHRNHATIRYAWMKISEARETDTVLKADLSAILDSIAASNS